MPIDSKSPKGSKYNMRIQGRHADFKHKEFIKNKDIDIEGLKKANPHLQFKSPEAWFCFAMLLGSIVLPVSQGAALPKNYKRKYGSDIGYDVDVVPSKFREYIRDLVKPAPEEDVRRMVKMATNLSLEDKQMLLSELYHMRQDNKEALKARKRYVEANNATLSSPLKPYPGRGHLSLGNFTNNALRGRTRANFPNEMLPKGKVYRQVILAKTDDGLKGMSNVNQWFYSGEKMMKHEVLGHSAIIDRALHKAPVGQKFEKSFEGPQKEKELAKISKLFGRQMNLASYCMTINDPKRPNEAFDGQLRKIAHVANVPGIDVTNPETAKDTGCDIVFNVMIAGRGNPDEMSPEDSAKGYNLEESFVRFGQLPKEVRKSMDPELYYADKEIRQEMLDKSLNHLTIKNRKRWQRAFPAKGRGRNDVGVAGAIGGL